MKKIITIILLAIFLSGCSQINETTNKDLGEEEREALKEEIKKELESEKQQKEELENKIKFEKNCLSTLEGIHDEFEIVDNLDDFKNIDEQILSAKKQCGDLYNNNQTMNDILIEIEELRVSKENEIKKEDIKKAEYCLGELKDLKKKFDDVKSEEGLEDFNDEFEKVEDECLNEVENSRNEIKDLFEEIDELRDNFGEIKKNVNSEICELYENRMDYDYKFTDYNDYQSYLKDEFEELVNEDNIGNYGGEENKYDKKVFFIYYLKGEWDQYKYWAIEVDAETGKLNKYEDISTEEGDREGFEKIWWIPERKIGQNCN